MSTNNCVPEQLISQITGPVATAACQPIDGGTPGHDRFCAHPLPKRIHVSWTAGDNKQGYWPMPTNRQPNISTSISASGDPVPLGVTFVLDDAVAQLYYDSIGPLFTWLADKHKGELSFDINTYIQQYTGLYLNADLYSMESVTFGKNLDCTTQTVLTGVNPDGSIACQETLTDTATYKQVVLATLTASCNIVYPNPDGSYGDSNASAHDYAVDQFKPSLKVTASFDGKVIIGFITDRYTLNPKISGISHKVSLGSMSTEFQAPHELLISPLDVAYPQAQAAYYGLGWPNRGSAFFNGYVRVDGTGSFRTTPIVSNNYVGELPTLPQIVNPVVFSFSSSD